MRNRPFPLSAFSPAAEKRAVIGGFTPVAGIFLPPCASAKPIMLASARFSKPRRGAAAPALRTRRSRSV